QRQGDKLVDVTSRVTPYHPPVAAVFMAPGQKDEVGYLADTAEQRGIETAKAMVGNNPVLLNQLRGEMVKRNSNSLKSFADVS
ncbi:hypothetical protein M3M33_15775, partial [Loigolactobacillus coryniformis]|uniref:hypothetical protein n=1 Tax=Loigolactobacillus coryniformis TaxID=1610 RepID=UPI00201A2CD5